MPIYEYQCKECGHHLEALQKVTDTPLRECPECQKNSLEKLVSATSFQLKGTGWYETDFKNKKTPAKSENTETKTESNTSSETKTETSSEKSSTKTGEA